MTNQLPPLEALWRHLEEMALLQPHLSAPKVRPVVEAVPDITARVLDDLKSPQKVAEICRQWVVKGEKDKLAYSKELSLYYSL